MSVASTLSCSRLGGTCCIPSRRYVECLLSSADEELTDAVGDLAVREALLKMLLDGTALSGTRRPAAIALAGAVGDATVREALVKTMLGGMTSWSLRSSAAEALAGAVSDVVVRDALVTVSLDATLDWQLRRSATGALSSAAPAIRLMQPLTVEA